MSLNEANQKIMSQLPEQYSTIFKEFILLTQIPHGSYNHEHIETYLKGWAEAHGFPVVVDETNNVLISVPASKGLENAPGVCLQGHTDMVCVKSPESAHDFKKDPLVLRIENGWLMATNTTLGADDGIGLALAMAAVQDDKIQHGPIELLFTSDEEVGLLGAAALKKCLKSKYLINIDSEDFGDICVSCAGGFTVNATRVFQK